MPYRPLDDSDFIQTLEYAPGLSKLQYVSSARPTVLATAVLARLKHSKSAVELYYGLVLRLRSMTIDYGDSFDDQGFADMVESGWRGLSNESGLRRSGQPY